MSDSLHFTVFVKTSDLEKFKAEFGPVSNGWDQEEVHPRRLCGIGTL